VLSVGRINEHRRPAITGNQSLLDLAALQGVPVDAGGFVGQV
jgi:hypothetical protein